MAMRAIYTCDICQIKNITDGDTMVFEYDAGGESSTPKFKLIKTVEGLYPFDNADKTTHVCALCVKSIKNAKDPKDAKKES